MLPLTAQDLLILCVGIVVHLFYRYRNKSRIQFPPGPPRWPIIGHTFNIPLSSPHKYYKDLGKQLGSKIIYLEGLGKSILVINDITIARDLLDKRSALYSNRPSIPMLNDVVGLKTHFAFMEYGNEWRIHRRMFQQYFSAKYLHRIQEREIECIRKGLLPNLVETPDDFAHHIRNCIGGLSMTITYGLPVQARHDPFVWFAEEALAGAAAAASPGRFLVNIIPWLKYVPEWMPGTGFKQEAKKIKYDLDRLEEEPYQETLRMMDDGTVPASFVGETLENYRDQPDFELQARYTKETAGQVYGALSETTVVALTTFLLGLLMRPDVQLKAQQELDMVVGPDRLPDCADLENMPYLSAVIKEVLRWNPPVSTGIPHTTSTDDVYMGYYIPKNCVVFANAYGMLHDDDIFPDPDEFKPERFLTKTGTIRLDIPDPEIVATFGFGRRICPGSHIARSTLYIAAASILYLFDVLPIIGDDGRPVGLPPQFGTGSLISEPLPFPCKITPRAGKDLKTLLQEYLGNETL